MGGIYHGAVEKLLVRRLDHAEPFGPFSRSAKGLAHTGDEEAF
jgi:hypothetical protein